MNYPNSTGYVAHSETSKISAEMLDDSGLALSYDEFILKELSGLGLLGATAEEMRKKLNALYPKVHNGSVNGRMSTLWRRKEIVKTKDVRQTDAKRPAFVYVHSDYRSMVEIENEYQDVVKPDKDSVLEIVKIFLMNIKMKNDGSAVSSLTPLDFSVVENMAVECGLSKYLRGE